MCWVMPPASPAATSVWRIASRSEVLPWSTWPMIVTTGARASRSVASSSKTTSSRSSSTCLIVISRSNSRPRNSTASSARDWVIVTIWPFSIRILMISASGTPSAEESSLTETPDSTVTGPVGRVTGRSTRSGARSRVPPRRPVSRGPRAACESITTRRRLPEGAFRGCRGAVAPFPAGRLCPVSMGAVEVGSKVRADRGGRATSAAGRAPSRPLRGATLCSSRFGSGASAFGWAAPGGASTAAFVFVPEVFFWLAAGLEPASARAAAASSTVSPRRATPASWRARATSFGSRPRSRAMSVIRRLAIRRSSYQSVVEPRPLARAARSSGSVGSSGARSRRAIARVRAARRAQASEQR